MQVKTLEIRDSATFIAVLAIRLEAVTAQGRYLLRRAGYAEAQLEPANLEDGTEPYIILVKLDGVEAQYDPFHWPNQRTMGCAHRFIIQRWQDLEPGSVVDVEHILGERPEPKLSERLTVGG